MVQLGRIQPFMTNSLVRTTSELHSFLRPSFRRLTATRPLTIRCMGIGRVIVQASRTSLSPTVFDVLRRVGTAILTPILFTVHQGHFRSALARKAVDATGHPLPWYTYPAIQFLSAKDFCGRRVLEFGAGQSTLWWSARAGQV